MLNRHTTISILKTVFEARNKDEIISKETIDFRDVLLNTQSTESKEVDVFYKGKNLVRGTPRIPTNFPDFVRDSTKRFLQRKPKYWAGWAKKVYNYPDFVVDFPEKEIYAKGAYKAHCAYCRFVQEFLPEKEFVSNRVNFALTMPEMTEDTNFLIGPGFYIWFGQKLKFFSGKGAYNSYYINPRMNANDTIKIKDCMENIEQALTENNIAHNKIGQVKFWSLPAVLFLYIMYDFYGVQIRIPSKQFSYSSSVVNGFSSLFMSNLVPSTELIVMTTKNPYLLTSLFYLDPCINASPMYYPNAQEKINKTRFEDKFGYFYNKEVFPLGSRSLEKIPAIPVLNY